MRAFILTFVDAHPWLSVLILGLMYSIAYAPFQLMNRVIRHRNIVSRGWPPSHLDADGDPIEKWSGE